MKFLTFATILAFASGFTTSPSVISHIGEKSLNNVFADSSAHRTRRATIVMDGKANGKGYEGSILRALTYQEKHVLVLA